MEFSQARPCGAPGLTSFTDKRTHLVVARGVARVFVTRRINTRLLFCVCF